MAKRTPSNVIDFAEARARRSPVDVTASGDTAPEDALMMVLAHQIADAHGVPLPKTSEPTPIRTPKPKATSRLDEPRVVLLHAKLASSEGRAKTTYSMVLPNGDIHHFFPLLDGVHHSFSRKYRGRFTSALEAEMGRPGAAIVGQFGADKTGTS